MGTSILKKMAAMAAAAVLLAGVTWAQTLEPESVILLAQKATKKGATPPAPATKPVATPPAPASNQVADPASNVRGKSIAIVAPQASGLAGGLEYLPVLVQGELVSNFTVFSPMKVLDRENLEKLYLELDAAVYADDGAGLQDLGNLAHTDYVLGGRITRTVSGYALQLSITRTANNNKTTIASYSGTFTFAELDNLTGVRRASLNLLQKVGVTLNDQAKETLTGAAAANHVSAQTALSQGIVAQRQGTEIAALSHYFQAAAFDPTLIEAISRSSILSANISSGNIGEDTRNDIAWRKKWIERLTETEHFFDSLFKTASIPYTLFYSTEIIAGKVDYKTETQTLSVNTVLQRNSSRIASAEKALTAVYEGLAATKRKNEWELRNWPERQTVTTLKPFEGWKKEFTIAFELVNDKGKVIGRTELKTGGVWNISPTDSGNVKKPVVFENVDANEITNKLSIRIETVNGVKAEIAARNGILQVKALSQKEWERNSMFIISKDGEIYKWRDNKDKDLTIPNSIWGEPITSIGKKAFYSCELTNVTIPNSVTSIGAEAFERNELTNVTIPNNVISVGNNAFSYNKLTRITIPSSVTSIGEGAFANNKLTNVSIPNGITSIGKETFYKNELISITIPNSITSIGAEAFYDNELTNVTIPKGVTIIGERAFANNKLTNVSIPNGITSIGDNAFYYNELTSITIPNSVTSIGEGTFRRNKLTNVTIPNSVTSIGALAFEDNHELINITISNSVTSIGEEAFGSGGSTRINRIIIGANVKIDTVSRQKRSWERFVTFYRSNGSKAGIYTSIQDVGKWNETWIYSATLEDAQRREKQRAEEKSAAEEQRLKDFKTSTQAFNLLNKGKAYSKNGEYDQAISEFNNALAVIGDSATATAIEIIVARADAYFGKRNYDKTIEECDRAIRFGSRAAKTHLLRGNAYLNKGDNNKAIPDYDKAIQLDFRNSQGIQFLGYANRGIAYQNQGDYNKAIADYEAALSLVPNHPDVYQRWLQARQQRDR